eukprot:COSAG02_NODE_10193_length_1998_cov_1.394945_1_plen_42_part_10
MLGRLQMRFVPAYHMRRRAIARRRAGSRPVGVALAIARARAR